MIPFSRIFKSLDITALQTFLAIVDTGSLVRASERLHIGQSTITTRLQRLEDEIGQVLFLRTKSGVRLTHAGIKFRHYAIAITDLWQVARQETSLPEGVQSILNLGCEFDLWAPAGKPMMQKIRTDYPDIAMSAWPGKQYELDQWLVSGMINAALSYHPISVDNCTIHELLSEKLVLVSTRRDSPGQYDPDFIYVYADDDMSRRHTAAYSDAGAATVSFGCASWALDFLFTQGGSVYLPMEIAAPYLQAGSLYRVIDAPEHQRNTYLITSDRISRDWPWLNSVIDSLKSSLSKQP